METTKWSERCPRRAILVSMLLGWLLLGLAFPALAQPPADTKTIPEILEFDRKFCPICKEAEAIIRAVQGQYPGQFAVRRMYIDEEEWAYRRYRVAIVPTQVFLDANGMEVFRHGVPQRRIAGETASTEIYQGMR